MIPVALKLSNFLSYGEDTPVLDFSTFQLACVTGKNGHGKSALFDAITWAIWGEARKASSDRKPDEGLLRIGATDLRVEFVFDLDGQRFRINRTFRKTAKSGSSSLELQVFDPSSDRFRALSESGSIRKTQTRINCLVRVSYDTFVNSAFILQGKVDAFTRRSPSDRKAILSEILELSRYDELGSRAREKAHKSEAEALRTRDLMVRIEEATIRRQDLVKQLGTARLNLETAGKTSLDIEKELESCNRRLAEIEVSRAHRSALIAERDGTLLRKNETEKELLDSRTRANEASDALKLKDKILADVEELNRQRKQETDLAAKQLELQKMETERARLDSDLEAARLKVVGRLDHWKSALTELHGQIEEGQTALSRRPDIQKSLTELVALRKQDRALISVRARRDEIEQERRTLEKTFDRQRGEMQVEIETGHKKRRELLDLLDKRTDLERTFNDTSQHLETFTALAEEMDRVKREGTETQQTEERLKERREGLGQKRQQLVAQIEQMRSNDNKDCPLCGTDLDETHRVDVITQLEGELEQLRSEFETVDKGLADTRDRRDACRVAYQKLRDQVHQLGDAPRLFAKAEAELAQVSSVPEDLEKLVGAIEEMEDKAKTFETSSEAALELKKLREQINELTRESKQHDDVRRSIEAAAPAELENARLDEIEQRVNQAKAQLPEAEEKHKAAQQWLDEKQYGQDIQEALEDMIGRSKDLSYDSGIHAEVKRSIEQLAESEASQSRIQQIEKDHAVLVAQAKASESRLAEITVSISTSDEQLRKYGDTDLQFSGLSAEKIKLAEKLKTSRAYRDEALQTQAALERDERACQELEEQREATSKLLKKCDKDSRIYRELIKAFGRDGIQALLIDQAIPELQDEANRILSRLTANRTQVALESLGELKSGGTKETLDIRISDEMGERRYELYSGGEAFRVDFAIRIALSKLLARRSGTPLQTLVIDEGFGTQDEEGLSLLVEAIQTISDEFEKILVITHVDAIKNAFPVRIEVIKEAESGSTFSIVR